MRNIEFVAILNILDEEGNVTGTREASISGRVYPKDPTEDNPSTWQLHDYYAFIDGVKMTNIDGADGDAITAQAETYATNNPEPQEPEPPTEPVQSEDPVPVV